MIHDAPSFPFVVSSEVACQTVALREGLETSIFLEDDGQRFDSLTPVRSAFGPPVYVAASPAAPFSTSVGMTK